MSVLKLCFFGLWLRVILWRIRLRGNTLPPSSWYKLIRWGFYLVIRIGSMPRCWSIRTMVLMMEAAGYVETSVSPLRHNPCDHNSEEVPPWKGARSRCRVTRTHTRAGTRAHTHTRARAYISHRLAERKNTYKSSYFSTEFYHQQTALITECKSTHTCFGGYL